MSTHKATLLRIKILGAAGLLKADATPADAYCVCQVNNQKKLKFQTPVVFDSDQPVWDYVHEFKFYHPPNSLQFSIHDWDELLGKTTLEAGQFFPQGCQTTVNLTGRPGLNATLEVDIELPNVVVPTTPAASLPQAIPSLPQTMTSPTKASPRDPQETIARNAESLEGANFHVRVTVISALGLKNVNEDISGASCVCEVGGKEEFRTSTVAASESATWRYMHELHSVSSGASLDFSVFGKKLEDSILLGSVSLLSMQFLPGGFDGKLVLKDVGIGCRITLALKVEVLQDKRAIRINTSLDPGLEYALGWNPKREKIAEKKTSPLTKPTPIVRRELIELEYSLGWAQAIEEEQQLLVEKRKAVQRARHGMLGLRQRAAQREAEAAKLEHLIALSMDGKGCGSCNRQSLDVRILLRALCRTGKAVCDFAAGHFMSNTVSVRKVPCVEGYEALHEVAEALASAAHLDTQIAELAAFLATEVVTCGMMQVVEKVSDMTEQPSNTVMGSDLLSHLRQTFEKAQAMAGGAHADDLASNVPSEMLPVSSVDYIDSLPFPLTMP